MIYDNYRSVLQRTLFDAMTIMLGGFGLPGKVGGQGGFAIGTIPGKTVRDKSAAIATSAFEKEAA